MISLLDMDRPEWATNEHPLCYMNANFTMAVQQQHNRNGTKFFVAFDGKGTLDDYLQIGEPLLPNMKSHCS